MTSRPAGKHAAPRSERRSPVSTPFGSTGGRHRAPVATPRLLATAPRAVGVAALAVATAGAASAGSPLATTGGSSAVSLSSAVADAGIDTETAAETAAEMELERPVRVRVSRDGVRQAAPQRLGSQAADAMAAVKTRVAQEAAAKRAAEKRAAEKAAAEKAAAEAKRWRLPVAKGAYRLTAQFGDCSGLWANCHTGLDFAAPNGTPVGAVAAGTVVEAAYAGSYGNRVVVRAADGTEMWYCHLSSFAVSAGEPVRSGQKVGAVGSTGNSTGPHLHLEIHPRGDGAVDPRQALGAQDVRP